MMPDKKKLAMLIIGKEKKEDDNDMDYKNDDYKDEDMEKDALNYCMKSFIKAIHHEDSEKALKLFKKLSHLVDAHMKDDDKDDEY